MDKKIEFKQILENIYAIYQDDIKKIPKFYVKFPEVLKKEEAFDKKTTLHDIKIGSEDGYYFIGEPQFIFDTEFEIENGKHIFYTEYWYFINKINFSIIIEMIAIFEDYIINLVTALIRYDKTIIQNASYKLSLSSKDIFFLTEHKTTKDKVNDLLVIFLVQEIIQEIIRSKKEIFKKIYKLLNISCQNNEEYFTNLIEIRNLIAHCNGKISIESKSKYSSHLFSRLYLKSTNVKENMTKLLGSVDNMKKAIYKKYQLDKI